MAEDNIGKIKTTFPDSDAWAYVVMYHSVGIGKWINEKDELVFHSSVAFSWNDVTELRVFDHNQELRFMRGENGTLLSRNSKYITPAPDEIREIRNTKYLMYGTTITDPIEENGLQWTELSEDRGGKLMFPEELKFKNNEVVIWLKIRNFLRFTDGPRLEVCDYTFTSFEWEKETKGDTKDV